ncbi:ABC-2 type transport system permease protein [Agromyces terreus]|uniref:ABC-2 type transport system permease protein n=1 Tax=Agromyces terreus TaxID=424795 RepID=A0A9X2GX62_9MICO|nr:ABC transporter permease [Agromyces terreus]MCP2370267.1 ABC-2 type transport system permease protein [Agromyces terreus]
MNAMLGTVVAVEARKARASRVMIWITVILVGGLVALTGGMLLGAASGDEQVLAKLGPLAATGGWAGLVGVVVQIAAAGGLLAFGVALSWIFGREFADGTVSGLFALPVRRPTIAVAKLVVFAVWALGVAVVLTIAVALMGLALGYGATDAAGAAELLRVPVLVVLTALLAVPAAWAATLGRGLLPGIAATVGIIVVSQVSAVIGVGVWVPFVAPALWAIAPSQVPPVALLAVSSVPFVFGSLCALAWGRLQLDR